MRPKLQTYNVSDCVTAFSTMRTEGYSHGNYAAFNINRYCGDNPRDIALNQKALCAELGIDEKNLVLPHQTHGTKGVFVDSDFLRLDSDGRMSRLEGCDYIATSERGVCVGVSTADCVPILLCCESPTVVVAVHAGWRGTLKRIAFSAVKEVAGHFGVSPQNFKAVIGPSISLDSFEVGDEVYDAFRNAGFDMSAIALRLRGKWHMDLWKANSLQLAEAGLPAGNISVSGICTYKQFSDFFSARRLGIESGRIFSGIMIRG